MHLRQMLKVLEDVNMVFDEDYCPRLSEFMKSEVPILRSILNNIEEIFTN